MLPQGYGERGNGSGGGDVVQEAKSTFKGIEAKFCDNGHVAREAERGGDVSKEEGGQGCFEEFATIITVCLFGERGVTGWESGMRAGGLKDVPLGKGRV